MARGASGAGADAAASARQARRSDPFQELAAGSAEPPVERTLPDALWTAVLVALGDAEGVCRAACSCRSWRDSASSDALWRELTLLDHSRLLSPDPRRGEEVETQGCRARYMQLRPRLQKHVAQGANDILVRLIAIGDSGAGKTNLTTRFAFDSFTDSFISTIGVDFAVRRVRLNGQSIKLQLWDTAGQVRFRPTSQVYYRGGHGFLFVYDQTNRSSFEEMRRYHADLLQFFGRSDQAIPPIFLCASKADLPSVVSRAEGMQMARDIGACGFEETSSKSGAGVDRAVEAALRAALPGPLGELEERRGSAQASTQQGARTRMWDALFASRGRAGGSAFDLPPQDLRPRCMERPAAEPSTVGLVVHFLCSLLPLCGSRSV